MLEEYFCPVCGKRFIPAPQHIYKDKGKIYCSWTCYNHRGDVQEQKKARAVEQCTKLGNLVRTHQDAIQAASFIGGTANGVRTACRTCMFYKGYLWRYKK